MRRKCEAIKGALSRLKNAKGVSFRRWGDSWTKFPKE